MNIYSDVTELKGVGEKKAVCLHRLGIYELKDLLSYFPRDYETIGKAAQVCEAEEYYKSDTPIVLEVKIKNRPTVSYVQKYKFINAIGYDATGEINIQWVNQVYLVNTLHPGSLYLLKGKIKKRGSKYYLASAKILKADEVSSDTIKLKPKYALTKGLTQDALIKLVRAAIDSADFETDYIKDLDFYCDNIHISSLEKYKTALEMIHFPTCREDVIKARERLVFDEFFFFLIGVRLMKEDKNKAKNTCIIPRSLIVDKIVANLPYSLTFAQKRTVEEIFTDISGRHLMNRLVQGDVGSGKTIVSFLALINTVMAGYQGVLMAPTEVLARQHYEQLKKLLLDNNLTQISVRLLTGTVTVSQKRKIKEELLNGEADILVGTHAVIQDDVCLKNPGLVITDEQHRFGVKQRERLANNNGKAIHTLVMSATPIPRTLAIIIYGDLDISIIDELPAKRLPIKNCVVGPNFRNKAYQFIKSEVENKHQALIVCPMVEESEGLEAENVVDYCAKIKEWFPDYFNIEYLHGRMSGKEKNAIMERFSAGSIDVLVSTTVIEVGINVPNTTVMMVENAERFGLAQLHQLRGRVGRGEFQSYCIFMCTSEKKETLERLEILNKSNDGFMIAREDLKQRGPGDMFGFRQSGDMAFKLGDIYTDANTLKLASEAVNEVFEKGLSDRFAKPGFSVL